MSCQKVGKSIAKLYSSSNSIGNRIHFPFSRFNRTKIRWSKNSKFLAKTRNVKLSKKGALRILDVSYRDAGIYACHAGLSMSELRLRVKPKPGDREPTPADYESIEEDEENIIETEGKCFDPHSMCVFVNGRHITESFS